MDTHIIRVQYLESAAHVALYPNLPTEELTELLQTVFNVSTPIIGFAAQDGTILPLSLVCRSPHELVAQCYSLLPKTPAIVASAPEVPQFQAVYEAPPKYEHLLAQYESEAAFPNASAPQAEFQPASVPLQFPLEDDEQPNTDEDAGLASINPQNFSKLLKFFAVMRSKKMINKEEARALEELVFDDNILLHAAFSVAESAKDADYLAEICKDIGQSVQTTDGRTALGAQEDLLYICDNLHQAGQLTDNQLLYLRHLVLVRDEVVAAIYEDFTADNNQNKLARSLVLLANTHPAEFHTPDPEEQPTPFEADFQVEQRVPQLDKHERRQAVQPQRQTREPSSFSSDSYTAQQQAQRQEEVPVDVRKILGVLNAATRLLLRSSKVSAAEVELLRDLVADEDEYVIAACDVYLQDQNMEELQDTLIRRVRFEARRRRDSEDFQQTARTTSSVASRQTDTAQSSPGESDQAVVDQVVGEQIRRVMLALGVEDGWGENVPMLFKRIVFVAAEAKLLSAEQAAVLCHLYAAGYDLVQAAWEVYQVAHDDRDFIDTLFRIVRDLDVKPSESELNSREKATQAAKEKLQRTRAAALKASEEIAKAKLELLNQTVALMVRQQFIDAEQGVLLLAKAQEGDTMIDAAIESYAHDRDVSRFVDTLQILANNPDQLEGAASSADNSVHLEGPGATDDVETAEAAAPSTDDERAQNELRDLVNLLFDDGKIGHLEGATLLRLISARDDRVLAAHDVYLEFQDVDDLVDSLLRVAKREASDAHDARQAEHGIEMRKLSRTESAGNDSADNDHRGVLTPDDIEQILTILGQNNAISEADMEVLMTLAHSHDQDINTVFDAYEQNKDVYKLIQSLQTLAAGAGAGAGNAGDDQNDDEDRSAEEALNKFLDIVEDMNLSEIETAALRLAIARDDDDIRAALEVFRLESDAEDLMDTLRRIALRVMRELGKAPVADIFPRQTNQQDETAENGDDEDQEVSDEDQLDEDTEDGEEDAENEAEDDADGDATLMTQGARQHIFPILVSELVKKDFLNSRQMLVLLTLLEQDNSMIHAALDVYDGDNNMAELVDTLQRISDVVLEALEAEETAADGLAEDGDDDVEVQLEEVANEAANEAN